MVFLPQVQRIQRVLAETATQIATLCPNVPRGHVAGPARTKPHFDIGKIGGCGRFGSIGVLHIGIAREGTDDLGLKLTLERFRL